MTLTLNDEEMGEAMVEFLAKRNVHVTRQQITLHATRESRGWVFTAEVKDIKLPPKEGPYR